MGSTPVGISASRGAAILGLSEFQSQFEVWQLLEEEREPGFNARRGYVLPERKDSAPLRWGKAFEDAVIALAEEAKGRRIVLREQFYSAKGFEFVSCHIDGAYAEEGFEGEPWRYSLHEGKTTSAFPFREKWGEPGTDRVPQTYQVQVQHQMACTGAGEDIVSVLVFPETPDAFEKMGWAVGQKEPSSMGWSGFYLMNEGKNIVNTPLDWARVLSQMGYFHQYPVQADHDAQKLLLEAYRDFWERFVLPGVEPEPRTYDDVKRAFPEPKGTLVCGPEQASWFAEMKDISEEIGDGGSLKKRKEELSVLALNWARKQDGAVDDESREATIFRDLNGKKLGQFAKQKNGVLVFRAS